MDTLPGETQKGWNISVENLKRHALPGSAPSSGAPGPVLVADHPALDMLNTVIRTEAGLTDIWQSDEDVLHWLVQTGLLERAAMFRFRRGRLLATARTLRELVRTLVIARKARKRLDLALLNRFLAKSCSHPELIGTPSGTPKIARRYDLTRPEGVLAPLTESAAELLATADFNLVRPCEGVDCVLWFYDRTKAHRRRWCSMEACGNRNKVTNFRLRQRA
jgi:predicted RNA-binding Zn ribbon-like protein